MTSPAPQPPRTGLRALRDMPRLGADAWQRSGVLARWLIASRAAVLVMTLAAASFGGLLAVRDAQHAGGQADGLSWLLCCAGLLLAHATNNLLNDWTDSVRGIDDGNYYRARYGTHVLQQGLLDERGLWRYILATGLLALTMGLALLWRTGTDILPPFVIGALCLAFYTWPMKQAGLGEPAVLLVWGPLMVGGTHLVTTGAADPDLLRPDLLGAGLLFGLGPTLVIFGKHIDKAGFDAERGVRTLPVRLGDRTARAVLQGLTVVQAPLLLGLVATDALPAAALLMLLATPSAVRLLRQCAQPRPEARPESWPEAVWPLWFVAVAFAHVRTASLLLVAGLGLDVLVGALGLDLTVP